MPADVICSAVCQLAFDRLGAPTEFIEQRAASHPQSVWRYLVLIKAQ